ncbi:pyrroloquinoline quinone biosynthesis peptide chaperone PqqD [Rhizobiaceae bacterium n13]|uniref:Pyrroloquinoline quinone biosynthesis peptide chaperone PqqD n=2 Tax=Ferirhizobium litorale TaxID=2927786 RepID=A0AAE3QH31_9HYPH|nr:pyrroloquinoline quinone biosynthesis peptide chaperone PqqD [Fererhizobium litorale]MDI7864157.1 pyrroloquinoline quinone biosynthesis peptide chaperone PqqD [Fererhizobium litorale]MDI7923768.1 pyrroloquinoline quinone biosynthesis peptide chaperone PqqD [Fererhizobium litorale]
MRLQRERKLLSSASTPALKPHVRLQYDGVRRSWAVLSPEKVFWPDEVSLAILRLCDGRHSVAQIVKELAVQYEAPHDEITADVEAFLQEWSDRFLVTL